MTDDARDAIMRATYEALCAEGYSELTAQAIADRTGKSKGALFYHYDSLDELIASFIEYLLEGYERRAAAIADHPPEERLAAFVEWWFDISPADETGYHTAMLELRAQAPYNELFREKLLASDEALRDTLVDILVDGIETGAFREHDPEAAADFMLAAFTGARIRHFTLGRAAYSERAYEEAREYLASEIFAQETEYPTEPAVSFPSDDRFEDAAEPTDSGTSESDTDDSTQELPTEYEDAG